MGVHSTRTTQGDIHDIHNIIDRYIKNNYHTNKESDHHTHVNMATSAIRSKLRIGMIPADGIGKEVLPVRYYLLLFLHYLARHDLIYYILQLILKCNVM